MTCKDCLHYEVCYIIEHYGADETENGQEYDCRQFKDRTKWVEQKHGRWELVEYQSSPFGVDQEYQCSICGTPVDDEEYRTRYCPNCGAKMDGERKDNERKAD